MCQIDNQWDAAKKEQLDVLCNDLERWDTQEEREIYIYIYIYTYNNWFALLYGRTQHYKVMILQLKSKQD